MSFQNKSNPIRHRSLWPVGPLLLLVVWWSITAAGWIRPIFLPKPLEVAEAICTLAMAGEDGLAVATGATFLRVLIGLLLGTVIGVPLGLLLGYFGRVYVASELPLDFFRSIPVTALFPFFLLVFGIGDSCKVAIVTWAVALIMIINTIYGVRGCTRTRGRYLRSIGANPFQIMRYHVIPEAAPNIVGGLRISISQAFIVVIVTEMLFGANAGIGYLLYSASLMYRTNEVIALIIVTGLLGYLVNKFAERIGKRIVFWQ